MNIERKIELLEELCLSQNKVLRFLNNVMFETVKEQRKLDKDKTNSELLELAWGANDIIADCPRECEIMKELEEQFEMNFKENLIR